MRNKQKIKRRKDQRMRNFGRIRRRKGKLKKKKIREQKGKKLFGIFQKKQDTC